MKIYKLAILGYPIKHSLSPKIHNYWLKEMNINGKYEAIKTPVKNLENWLVKPYSYFFPWWILFSSCRPLGVSIFDFIKSFGLQKTGRSYLPQPKKRKTAQVVKRVKSVWRSARELPATLGPGAPTPHRQAFQDRASCL